MLKPWTTSKRFERLHAAVARLARRPWLPLALCLIASLPGVWWLGWVDFFHTHDGDMHRWRQVEFWRLWRSGQVPVRWAPDLNYGFGSPLFTFYSPLPYLLGGVAQAWGLSAAEAVRLVFAGGLLLGSLGMYRLATEWYNQSPSRRWAALLAAVTYLYTPYILVNVTHRGALAETLALGIAPWLLWAEIRCLRETRTSSSVPLALAIAAMVLAHHLTTLIVGVLAAALALCWLASSAGDWRGRVAAIRRLSLAVLLGLALSAFFWLPMIEQIGYVQVERARGTAEAPKFAEHFISPPELVLYQIVHDYTQDFTVAKPSQPHLGLVQTSVVMAGVVVGLKRGWRYRASQAFLSASMCLALYLISPLSRDVWERIPFLAMVQFPWRFLGVIAVLGGLAAGSVVIFSRRGALAAITLSMSLILSGMWVNVEPYQWVKEWETPENLRDFEWQTTLVGLTADDEFMPTWVHRPRWDLLEPVDHRGDAISSLDEISLIDANSTSWVLDVRSGEPSSLTFDSFYFPSWEVKIDGHPVKARPSNDLGLLTIDVPSGVHRVVVEYKNDPSYTLGVLASVLAGLSLVAILILGSSIKWRYFTITVVIAVLLLPFIFSSLSPIDQTRYIPAPSNTPGNDPLRFLGAILDESLLESHGIVYVTLLFFTGEDIPDKSPTIRVKIASEDGLVLAESIHEIGQGLRPVSIWQPNMILADRFEWLLSSDLSGGLYSIYLTIGDDDLGKVGSFVITSEGADAIAFRNIDSSPVPRSKDDQGYHQVRFNNRLFIDDVKIKFAGQRESLFLGDVEDFMKSDFGGDLTVILSWRYSVLEDSAYDVDVRLVDSQGRVRAVATSPLIFSKGVARIRQTLTLRIPPHLLPGRYRLELLVRDERGNWLVSQSNDPTEPPRAAVALWSYEVGSPCDCVPDGGAVVGEVFDDGLRLLGYERRVSGDALDVVVYWQAYDTPRKSYTAFIHLLDRDGRLVDQFDAVPYDGTRLTTTWGVGRVVPFAARFRLPEEGGPFEVRIGMYEFPSLQRLNTADGRPHVSLGLVERSAQPKAVNVAFEGGVQLLGYRIERSGDQGIVTLYWRTSRPILDEYSVFVHVLDAAGAIVAQGDGPPEFGKRTTADWPRGQVIVDPHTFPLPDARPLRLRVGLYRLADNHRLRTASGTDFVDLGEIPWP